VSIAIILVVRWHLATEAEEAYQQSVARPLVRHPHPAPALIPVAPHPAPAQDGPQATIEQRWELDAAYIQGRYEDLDLLIDRLATLHDRFDDGRFKLSAVRTTMEKIVEPPPAYSESYKGIAKWRKARPLSAAGAIAEAIYWRMYAWDARGPGLANTVTPEGFQLFSERLHEAANVLQRTKRFSSKNPLWYAEAMEASLGLGESREQLTAIYDEGIGRYPQFFPLHFQMLRALQPRWGGSFEETKTFIDHVVESAHANERAVLYARLWWNVDQISDAEVDIFVDGGADWKPMNDGFEALAKAWPKSLWNRSSQAYFACRAGDYATYAMLRVALGANIHREAFPANFTVDVCDRRSGPTA